MSENVEPASLDPAAKAELDRAFEEAHPGALPVALVPGPHRIAEQMELHAPLALARPDVGQRVPQLGVPQERGQLVEGDDHADVVDRAVGDRADRHVGK